MEKNLFYVKKVSTGQWATTKNPFYSKEEAKKEMLRLYADGETMRSLYIEEQPSESYNKWMRNTSAY